MKLLELIRNNVKFPIYLGIINFTIILFFATIYYFLWNSDKTLYFNGLNENSNFIDILYFTTTTQSTIGYGDITPIHKLSRIIVMCQQISMIIGALISIEILDDV